MSKIYYMKKPVKIGDMVTINGLTIELTGKIVQNNPDIFDVADEDNFKPYIITEDGVGLFHGDNFWKIEKTTLKILRHEDMREPDKTKFIVDKTETPKEHPDSLLFSTREAAEEYIAKHKEKTLEGYEKILTSETKKISYNSYLNIGDLYLWLKKNDSKLYWTKVLQLIADDLNKNCNITSSSIYSITYIGGCQSTYDAEVHLKSTSRGEPKFLCGSLARKAIEIMGDKLDLIYKQ